MFVAFVASYLREVGDAEDKANGIEDVRLAAAVQPGNGIEERIKVWHDSALLVRLEAVDDHLLREGRIKGVRSMSGRARQSHVQERRAQLSTGGENEKEWWSRQ